MTDNLSACDLPSCSVPPQRNPIKVVSCYTMNQAHMKPFLFFYGKQLKNKKRIYEKALRAYLCKPKVADSRMEVTSFTLSVLFVDYSADLISVRYS